MRQSNRHYLYVWLLALGMLWTMLASLPATANNSDRFTGTVLFLRHALAPGAGDPSGFLVDDQRRPGGGGMLIFQASSYDDALAWVRQDPMIVEGLVAWQLQEWIPVIGDDWP